MAHTVTADSDVVRHSFRKRLATPFVAPKSTRGRGEYDLLSLHRITSGIRSEPKREITDVVNRRLSVAGRWQAIADARRVWAIKRGVSVFCSLYQSQSLPSCIFARRLTVCRQDARGSALSALPYGVYDTLLALVPATTPELSAAALLDAQKELKSALAARLVVLETKTRNATRIGQ